MPPEVLLNRSVLLTADTADLPDEERGRRSLKVSPCFPVLTVFLSFVWIFLLRLMSLLAADPADGRKEAPEAGSIHQAGRAARWASVTGQREVSFGISLSVRIISTGVLVFTQTSVSLKNFAGTFSMASPTVFTGRRLPFFVVFQS